MAIDYEKVKKLYKKGKSAKEIANILGCKVNTLYNNSNKWRVGKVVAETLAANLEKSISTDDKTGLVQDTRPSSQLVATVDLPTEKEYTQVKKFYKTQMKQIRARIAEITKLGTDVDQYTFQELQLLTGTLKVLQLSKQIDYEVYDILSFKDLASLDIQTQKMELETYKMAELKKLS